jgi:transglutaminase-like putative cysteine protease
MSDATWHPQQIVALGLAVVMAVSGCRNTPGVGQGGVAPVQAPATSTSPAPPDAAAIAAVRDTSQRILASTPKSMFDPDQKAAELGADVNALFAFVRDNVRHEVYAGVLRGARGTLISHAGNAWDKSVLLAALLRHHKREVRFARGRLTRDRATALVTKMFDQARQPVAGPAVDVPASVAARSRDLIARIDARWRSAQSDLLGALDRGGVSLGQTPPVTEAMLSEEAADHAWVEYRDGDRWVPLDPSAATQPGETATTATETFAEVPVALQHRVAFRVKVEERRNQALTERDAFIWAATAGALHGAHVIFTHQIGQTPLGRWRATPVLLVDQQAYGALSFTDAGLEVPAKASNALVGEASRQVQGVGRIGELFGSPAPPPPPVATAHELTGVWLDVEFTDPSGRSETVRREILDRIGAVARAQGAVGTAPLAPLAITSGVPIAFAGLHACAVTAGPLDPRLGLERLAPSFSAIDDALALQKLAGSGTAKIPPEEQPRLRRVVESLPVLLESTAQGIHLLSQRLASQIRATGGTPLFYEATPRLAIVSLDPAASTLAVDLRRNALRVVARGGQGQDIVRANLARGVLDGVIEDAVAAQALAGVPSAIPLSTVALLDRARTEGIPIIAGSGRGALAALTVPDVARARLAAALERPRQVVVAPARAPSVASTPRFAWWQVDGETGDTIGVLDSGLLGAQLPNEAALADTVAAPGARALGAGAAAGGAGFITITLTAKDALIVGIGLGIIISSVMFFVAAVILSAE